MRLMNITINSANKYVLVGKNQLQTQSFFKSSFSIKEFERKYQLSKSLEPYLQFFLVFLHKQNRIL